MKFLKNENLILNIIKFSPILFVLTVSIISTIIFINQQEKYLEHELENSQKQFIESNKNRIQEEVNRVVETIQLEQKNLEKNLKEQIKTKVYDAHSIVTNIYNTLSKENHSKDEILSVIKSTLEKIRFDNGRGYYFLFDTKGTNLLHPINREFEGKNILNYPDAKGYNFAEKMVNTIKNKSEDFDTYYWYKGSDKSRMYKKISFFKYFEPLNIGIATGEYIDSYEKELQDKLLSRIRSLSYGKNGYIFVYNLEGVCLAHFKKNLINVNRYNLKDSQGNYVVQDVLNFAKENNEGFMSYIAIFKPNGIAKSREKKSYVKFYKNWNWVLGTGFYTDDFDAKILEIQEEIKLINKETIDNIIATSIIVTILFVILSFIISKVLSQIFHDYRRSVNKEIDANLKKSEQLEFQALLLEQSVAATDVVSEKGKFIYVNELYVKLWGYDNKDEILGTSPISHCSDPEMPKTIIETTEQEGEHTFQFKAKRKDGTTFDVLMAVKCIQLNGKKYYIGSSMDISDNLELSKRYQTIFTNAREGVFLHELDGTLIDVNPYIERLFNITKENLIDINFNSFFKDSDTDRAELLIKDLMSNGEIKFEMELQKIDGTLFYASIKSQIIELEGRQIVYGTLKDLTFINENILMLERSQKVFESLQEGVMITNTNGYMIDVNKAFSEITGYTYYQAIGNKASILKSGEHNDEFYKELWNNLQKKDKWSGKIINKKKNGEKYTSFLTINAIKDHEGTVQNYVGIFADISEILKYEKELREKDILLIQQSKMASMGEMIDNIAHQWKQPLNAISTASTGIKIQNELNVLEEQTLLTGLDTINNSTKYLTETIDDFRNFFNNDKTKKEFTITNSVNRVYLLLKSKLKNRNIEIIENINDVTIYGVENEIVQVTMNLLSNSIDALDDSKEDEKYIFFDGYIKDKQVFISVKDNAGGIPEDIIEKVFESRFTTKEQGKGTGIGLYMSKNIIESYEGTLTVKNSIYTHNAKEYKGADFIIKIPIT